MKQKHVLLYFGNITSKKISLYPLALKNIQPAASKLVVNIKFISNTVLEVICKESVQIEVIRVFRMLGAKHFINSPEVDSNGLFKISNLLTRMKKIKDRQGNKNDKLRMLAVRILKSKRIELHEMIKIGYINIGGLSDNKIFNINNLIQRHELDILGVAETRRDNKTPLLRGYKVLNSKKSVQVRDRYSNKEGIIVLGRNRIVSEAIDNITDEGVTIKVNDSIFIFIYRSLKSTEFNIVKPTLNQYLYKRLYNLRDYNLEQHKTLLQQILDNHAMYGLSEIDILTNTYKDNDKESKPDKIFTNTIVYIKISTINNIRLLTRLKVVENITNKIEILIKKNANIIRTLNINDYCAALHNIILSGVYRLRIRKQSRTNFNPVIQHISRAREKARHNNPILYERLYKEVKNLTKNLPDTKTRDLKVEHIGLKTSQLEAIINFHGNAIPNNRQNNSNELLNSFVLDGKITSLEETVNWIKKKKIHQLSVDEVEKCMKILKGGKAGGICGIKNEFLKICPRNFIVELTYMFNNIFRDKEIPLLRKKHMIQPIPKGDSEFRSISLIDKTPGFRLKHSTLNHVLTLDTRLRHSNGEGILVTLDISKVYDSVYR
ncbi:hypothetical protein CWI36_0494p0030 [Hamiltosporidium magnivora]|uniref:Reverse transcriptase domain-containing protein n=1 Tax=Hamiltosporidium magnivora TaxID=148818 RepID=A0A4Q9LGW7_9MICR|nr:hypothetical protein CWI36_0494p0030 [Hamiltosporidium magnivora]